jgi:hypothetical protein
MKRHGGNIIAYYLVKEVNLKKLYIVGFQLYNTVISQNCGINKKGSH